MQYAPTPDKARGGGSRRPFCFYTKKKIKSVQDKICSKNWHLMRLPQRISPGAGWIKHVLRKVHKEVFLQILKFSFDELTRGTVEWSPHWIWGLIIPTSEVFRWRKRHYAGSWKEYTGSLGGTYREITSKLGKIIGATVCSVFREHGLDK